MSIQEQAERDLRELMGIPSNYKVLFLQGGATLQFAMVPINLMRGKPGCRLRAHRRVVEQGDQGSEAVRRGPRRRLGRGPQVHLRAAAVRLAALARRRLPALLRQRDHRRRRVRLGARRRRRAAGGRRVVDLPVAPARRVEVRPDLRRRAEEHRACRPDHRDRARGPARPRAEGHADDARLQGCRPTTTRCSTPRRPTAIYIAGLVFQWLKRQGGLAAIETAQRRQGEAAVRLPRQLAVLPQPGRRASTARA